MFIGIMDQTIVATALPAIAASLGAVEQIAWIVAGYLITAAISAPVYGRLGDASGRRRMMVVALTISLVGSVLCAMSTSIEMLIGARIVQGMAEEVGNMAFETAPGAVVSGLPLMSMPNEAVEATLRAAFKVLRPGGFVVQFTYAPRCPANRSVRERLGLECRLQELVWRNFPPARVYRFYRRGD